MPPLLGEGIALRTEPKERKQHDCEVAASAGGSAVDFITQIDAAMYSDYPFYQTDDVAERASDLALCHEIRRDVSAFLRHLELGEGSLESRETLIESYPLGPNRVAVEIAFHMHDLGMTVANLDSEDGNSLSDPPVQISNPEAKEVSPVSLSRPSGPGIMSVEDAKVEMKKRLTDPATAAMIRKSVIHGEAASATAVPDQLPDERRYASACQQCQTCLLNHRGVLVGEESGGLYRIEGCTREMRAFVGHLCGKLGFEQLPDDAVVFIKERDNQALDQYTHDPSLIVANNVADYLEPYEIKEMRRNGVGPETEEVVVEKGFRIKDAISRFVFASSSGKERVAVNYSVGKADQIAWGADTKQE